MFLHVTLDIDLTWVSSSQCLCLPILTFSSTRRFSEEANVAMTAEAGTAEFDGPRG